MKIEYEGFIIRINPKKEAEKLSAENIDKIKSRCEARHDRYGFTYSSMIEAHIVQIAADGQTATLSTLLRYATVDQDSEEVIYLD